eukprot:9313274-Ditylum_brightwellii.AAC.1
MSTSRFTSSVAITSVQRVSDWSSKVRSSMAEKGPPRTIVPAKVHFGSSGRNRPLLVMSWSMLRLTETIPRGAIAPVSTKVERHSSELASNACHT